jgi:hypothetical protein
VPPASVLRNELPLNMATFASDKSYRKQTHAIELLLVALINPAGNYATLFAPRGGQGPDQMAQRLRELIAQTSQH